MTHKTAYKTELKPTPAQIILFQKALGISRFAYNWGLAGCIASHQNQDTVFKPNAIHLHKHLNTLKTSDFPWMREVSKCVPQMALRDLQNAYNRFFKKTADFPRFKKEIPLFLVSPGWRRALRQRKNLLADLRAVPAQRERLSP